MSENKDCSQHRRDVFGTTDMKALAQEIGDLDYLTLSTLLWELSNKIHSDGQKDFNAGRTKLSHSLFMAQMAIYKACTEIQKAWQICKPFMIKSDNDG